jgi:hypothetical protein
MFLYPGFGVCHPDTAQILCKSSEPKSTGIGGIFFILVVVLSVLLWFIASAYPFGVFTLSL